VSELVWSVEIKDAAVQHLCVHWTAALMALKKKKMYETQLEQCENNILRVNEQQMMLENQRTTVETVTALRDAAHASKSTMSEMKITDVDQVSTFPSAQHLSYANERG
jgi:hypothetical protein